ncbi:biotin carboxylase N-terminal domain-containing protein [Seongchinamella unica]|nr:biotin carboxylase N-terminal domain-containing protein [Seongchinamella unica]
MTFSSVLVANRGEIALRVMRTVHKQGMRCVAVYSDADALAPHVQFADEAVHIGASPAADSYLAGDRIIQAALAAGAEAIHPGYGFLSENADFARAVVAAGLVFIGPGPEAIEVMGDKAVSKRAMLAAGVPCVPGYQGEDQSDERLSQEAGAVGFPLMVKAAAGGGGRGMRLVQEVAGVAHAIRLARSEAQNAFGSGDLILERALTRPRHVEFQVFADQFGNVIHLGERDCSVQRRHQKVIEECPCPVMTPRLRERMGAAAVEAARAVNYQGAGTVEFLLDEAGEFYFLEMNTRLQVEHPVTEMVTGLDLVQMQLEVAQGLPLRLEQGQVALQGHAIEVRLYAEDPARDFLPSAGPVVLWSPPTGDGVRVDAGIVSGSEVSPYYDSMVAKIICRGDTRGQARQRLLRALDDTVLLGPASNRDFLLQALSHPSFARGEATTAFISEQYAGGFDEFLPSSADLAAAAVLHYVLTAKRNNSRSIAVPAELRNWCSTGDLMSVVHVECAGGARSLQIQTREVGTYQVSDKGAVSTVQVREIDAKQCRLIVDGRSWRARYQDTGDGSLYLSVAGAGQFCLVDVRSRASGGDSKDAGPLIRAPMHGLVMTLDVANGDPVELGTALLTLEAMKMQHVISAPLSGTVANVTAAVGSQVASGELLMEIASDEQST